MAFCTPYVGIVASASQLPCHGFQIESAQCIDSVRAHLTWVYVLRLYTKMSDRA